MSVANNMENLEFRTEIKYRKSSFNLQIKIVKDNCLAINLIYKEAIEYYLEYPFIEIQKKNKQFRNIQHFIQFLNNYKNEYCFEIIEINKEYCYLLLELSYNEFNETKDFKLLNKNKNLYIESYKEKILLDIKVDKLIELCNKSEGTILNDISFERREISYCFKLLDHSYIIFFSNIDVEINIDNEILNEQMSIKEFSGCALVFTAVVASQLDISFKNRIQIREKGDT